MGAQEAGRASGATGYLISVRLAGFAFEELRKEVRIGWVLGTEEVIPK
jgi:hypothetical protein